MQVTALKGHVVVVNVWASWCVQCRAESPVLARLSRRLQPQVRFVGIDEQDVAAKALAFAAAAGTEYPHLLDPHGTLLARLPMLPGDAIPSTLIIDKQGRAAACVVGDVKQHQLLSAIRRTAGGRSS